MPGGCLLPPGSLALRVLPSLISKPPKSTEYLQALPFSPQKSRSYSCRFLSKPQNKYHLVSISLFAGGAKQRDQSVPGEVWAGMRGQLCPGQLRWAIMVSTGFIGWHLRAAQQIQHGFTFWGCARKHKKDHFRLK